MCGPQPRRVQTSAPCCVRALISPDPLCNIHQQRSAAAGRPIRPLWEQLSTRLTVRPPPPTAQALAPSHCPPPTAHRPPPACRPPSAVRLHEVTYRPGSRLVRYVVNCLPDPRLASHVTGETHGGRVTHPSRHVMSRHASRHASRHITPRIMSRITLRRTSRRVSRPVGMLTSRLCVCGCLLVEETWLFSFFLRATSVCAVSLGSTEDVGLDTVVCVFRAAGS